MKKTLVIILIALLIICTTVVTVVYFIKQEPTQETPEFQKTEEPEIDPNRFVWGVTIRPYVLTTESRPYQNSDLEEQFKYAQDILGNNGCVRANIEGDLKVNDKIVALKKKYGLSLYFILEEAIDFNSDINFEKRADALAQKIVSRYKGRVEYYQLANEITGTLVDLSTQDGSIDAGYGLKIDRTRYQNALRYTKRLSEKIRSIDPNAKIVLSGHWVLIQPVLQMIDSGVQVDIVGWNWGSGMGNNPGVTQIDNYGTVNIPALVKKHGEKFWIVEANYDDGSSDNQEEEQARYISNLAENTFWATNVNGYFHFILTDTHEEGPASKLGLLELSKNNNGEFQFGSKKPAYNALKSTRQKNDPI